VTERNQNAEDYTGTKQGPRLVNGQDLFLGMGCRGRGQFPFPGSSL
jgi:hypothetical protein